MGCNGYCHCHAGADGMMHPPCCDECASSTTPVQSGAHSAARAGVAEAGVVAPAGREAPASPPSQPPAPSAGGTEVEKLREALAVALAGLERAKDALNHDRTGLADALGAVLLEVEGRWWMRPEGNWASYSWEEHTADTLRKEIGWAFDAIGRHGRGGLKKSGDLAVVEVRAADDALRRARALCLAAGVHLAG